MPALLWLDITALFLSLVLSTSLTFIVLGSAPRKAVNQTFSLFALMEIFWVISALFLRFSFWAEHKGFDILLAQDPATWHSFTAVFIGLMTASSLLFLVTYLKKRTRFIEMYILAGVVLTGVLYVFQDKITLWTNIRLTERGTITEEMNVIGIFVMMIFLSYMIWSLILLLKQRSWNKHFLFGFSLIFMGIVIGGALNVPFPTMSVVNTLGLFCIGYVIIRRQILNPLKTLNIQLESSLAEKEVLLKEVHHRVKNNLQILSSLLRIPGDKIRDEATKDKIRGARNRIKSIALVHDELYKSENLAKINFSKYITQISNHLIAMYNQSPDELDLKLDLEEVFLNINQAIPLGLITNELVTNSLVHAFPSGDLFRHSKESKNRITISLHTDIEGKHVMVVADNGIGLPQRVSGETAGISGLQIVKDLVRQINGELEFDREEGISWRITF